MESRVITTADFGDICRTCLCNENLMDITESFSNLEIRFLLDHTLTIKIAPGMDEYLPQKICKTCLNSMLQIYEFKKQCHKNEDLLKLVWKNTQVGVKTVKVEPLDQDDGEMVDEVKPAPIPKRQCPYCHKLVRVRGFKEHIKIHSIDKPYKCDLCSYRTRSRKYLIKHRMVHTGERPFQCNSCENAYIRPGALQKHKNQHHSGKVKQEMEAQYNCEFCGRDFKRLRFLQTHITVTHEKSNPNSNTSDNSDVGSQHTNCVCDICGLILKNEGTLKIHLATHYKQFLCSECGRCFSTKSSMETHMTLHTGEKPFPCDLCPKRFRHTGGLQIHKRVHLGLRPYHCKQCPMKFRQQCHLNRHTRTHTGEKPFACKFCSKRFALKVNLTIHIRTHTLETPFVCRICRKGFKDPSGFKKHIKKIHPDMPHLDEKPTN